MVTTGVLAMIRAGLAVAALVLSLAACSRGLDSDAGQPQPSLPQLSLHIAATFNDSAVTRAVSCTGGGAALPTATRAIVETDEDGSGGENYIDVRNGLHILFFGLDDRFMFEFVPEEVLPVSGSLYPQEWTLRGPIASPPAAGFKVVVLANWPSAPSGLEEGVTTIDDICRADWSMYRYSAPFTPSETTPIPMYGIRTYSVPLFFSAGVAAYLGRIDLLRSISKVIVRGGAMLEESISSVSLVRYNRYGAAAPLDMLDDTKNWSHDHSTHLYNNSEDNDSPDDGSLPFAADDSGTEWTIYVPEYRNMDTYGYARTDCAAIAVKFGGIDRTYTINFRDYSVADTGLRFNLLRNHVYRYTIDSVNGHELSLNLVAQPWSVSEFDYDYTKSVGISSKIVWTDDNHVLSGKRVIARTAGDLVCSFTIATPLGAKWYAVFEEKSGDLDHFKFRHADGTLADYAEGIVDGAPVTLSIAQAPGTVGTAKVVIYASYGNVNLAATDALGGPYILVKD